MFSKKSFFNINTLKQFDAFAKPLEEVQIKTVWGGIGKRMVLDMHFMAIKLNNKYLNASEVSKE